MTKHSVIEPDGAPRGATVYFHGEKPLHDTIASESGGARLSLLLAEEKLVADAQRELQIEYEHTNRMATIGQLAASITHEVSQPIAATMANAQAALRWLGAEEPNLAEAREALGRIVRDVSRASSVVRQIRNFSRKAPREEEEAVDLNPAIRDVIEMTRSEAVENGISVRTELAEALPVVQGSRVELQQVVLNLIVNAFEAMREWSRGAPEMLISTAKTEAGGVLVSVEDTGPGLGPSTGKHVFRAFHTTKPDGLGLGLYICGTIIEAHGGRLWAKSTPLQGAVFQFELPALREAIGSDRSPYLAAD